MVLFLVLFVERLTQIRKLAVKYHPDRNKTEPEKVWSPSTASSRKKNQDTHMHSYT